jgi:hypothetical protein
MFVAAVTLDDDVVDLVAFDPCEPGKWYLRTGDQCPVLGANQLRYAAMTGGTIRVYPDPSSWLLAKRDGFVVLDWAVPIIDLALGVGRFGFDHLSPWVGKALNARLSQKLQAEPPAFGRPAKEVRHAT